MSNTFAVKIDVSNIEFNQEELFIYMWENGANIESSRFEDGIFIVEVMSHPNIKGIVDYAVSDYNETHSEHIEDYFVESN